jgi:Plasmid encoded RepA protein
MAKHGKRGLTAVGDLVTPKLLKKIQQSTGPTPIQQRLIETAALSVEQPDLQTLLYQHTVFCQTSLPYRDPGDKARTWERLNGDVHLKVLAGEAMHPEKGRLVEVGLPFGPKCRMVLMHINQRAIVTESPHIIVEDTLSKFVRNVLKLDSKGRNMRVVKDQLARLSASSIRLGIVRDGHAVTVNSQIVTAFDVWFPKNENQRVLWPSTISLSLDYFQSLINHAVPLNEAHIAALSHSALALDIYAWLAQRLHRIPVGKPAHVSWAALHGQFGQGYNPDHMSKFRQVFRVALKEVLTLYKGARVDDEEPKPPRLYSQGGRPVWREKPAKGLTFYNSPPPVRKLLK